MKVMKTIIIECNPSKNSFGESIKEKVISVLDGKKKEYEIIELYKDNFNPVMSEEDEKLYSKGESKDEMLNLLADIIGFTYQQNGNKIVLTQQ